MDCKNLLCGNWEEDGALREEALFFGGGRVESSFDRRQRKVWGSGTARAGFPLADYGKEALWLWLQSVPSPRCGREVIKNHRPDEPLQQAMAQTFTVPGGPPTLLVI